MQTLVVFDDEFLAVNANAVIATETPDESVQPVDVQHSLAPDCSEGFTDFLHDIATKSADCRKAVAREAEGT